MTARPLIVFCALLIGAAPAFAQRQGSVQRWPTRERDAGPPPSAPPAGQDRARERTAQPRQAPPPRTNEQPDRPPVTQAPPRSGRDAGERGRGDDRRADRRDIDRVPPRVAVPRQGPPPRLGDTRPRTNVYIVRPPAFRYTPRFNRPYVYGALGPGYFYYGSFGWYPRSTYFYDRGYFGRGYGEALGEVRLRVEPRWAEVYVDGFFAGTVDDFDGIFQSLKLESGPYHLEIVAPGYETLEVDLRVPPGEKITYRGALRPAW